jgi:hypothetical protein
MQMLLCIPYRHSVDIHSSIFIKKYSHSLATFEFDYIFIIPPSILQNIFFFD